MLNQQILTEWLNKVQDIGILKGFQHFETRIRGKEELLITIKSIENGQCVANFVNTKSRLFPNVTLNQENDLEHHEMDSNTNYLKPTKTSQAIFLLGSYIKYQKPYVWLRTRHAFLSSTGMNISSSQIQSSILKNKFKYDYPVELETLKRWTKKSNPLLLIKELIEKIIPEVENAFQIDQDYILNIQNPKEQFLLTGSILNFLANSLKIISIKDDIWIKMNKEFKWVLKIHHQLSLNNQLN
ncbi:hypothetical protein M0812_16165 [Anaeramoeba flamelloides]|uniref:DUF7886 domain-containing protein n=1 Tax=Anaeramoeba flamelloides TaxID=1746091 RepID=A0AAV7ZEF8_9EUKA|nr:hypothetical protein M0812_16165 [Anaeramoeba flamelloides]